jgi:hypothetical protein
MSWMINNNTFIDLSPKSIIFVKTSKTCIRK